MIKENNAIEIHVVNVRVLWNLMVYCTPYYEALLLTIVFL